jgi:hypothetical protein
MLSMSFSVRAVHAEFAAALAWHLAPFRRQTVGADPFTVDLYVAESDQTSDPPQYSFFVASVRKGRNDSIADLLALAVWNVHQLVPQGVRDFLFLHAGAVVRDGGAVLLPAPMDHGKSSLTLALLQQGFGYLSDEYGTLDPITGRAYPLPKRIGLDQDSLRWFGGLEERLQDRQVPPIHQTKRYVRPEDVSARIAGPAEVRWIVFPTPSWDGPPRLVPVPAAEAIEQMAANSFNLDRYLERGVIMLSRVAREAKAFRIEGGTPTERAELLAESLV